jgi:hypothetical protein
MPDRRQAISSGPERDEAVGYRPVSGLAVAAVFVAGAAAIAVLLIVIGVAYRHRPILSKPALVLAAVGLALSVASYCQVRRADGTRSGWGLIRIAFWLSLLSLGGYGAYYLAIDSAVHKQAEAIADEFLALLAEGKPELAFRLTRPPGIQRGIEKDEQKIRARFGATELHQFDQSDLTRAFRTWRQRTHFEFKSPGTWEDKPDGFLVVLNYMLRTPEGEFEVAVSAQGFDDKVNGERVWQILSNTTGLRPERRLTLLGRICEELQIECARRFLRFRWLPSLEGAKSEDLAAIVRKEGAVLPDGERQKVFEELRRPGSINLLPGSSATRQPGLPTMYFDKDGIRIVQNVQVNVPTVESQCPAVLTIRIVGDDLVNKMLALAGPDWEKQPLVPNEENPSSVLVGFKKSGEFFKVTELNIRPSLPRIAPAPPGS